MGHLINPTSMRIGWYHSWEDIWFVRHIYYPEFLQIVLKIRFFLAYALSTKLFDKTSLFYSHFVVLRKNKLILVCIFLYHGNLEYIIDNFFFDNWLLLNKTVFSTKLKRYVPRPGWLHNMFKIVLTFQIFYPFSFKKWPKKCLRNFLNCLYNCDFGTLKLIIKKLFFKKKQFIANFLFYIFLYHKLLKFYTKFDLDYNFAVEKILKRFLFGYFIFVSVGASFKAFSIFLSGLLTYILFYKTIIVKFFLISNENITAKFLSRFLARKLAQGYSVRELVNPIKKELSFVSFLLRNEQNFKEYKINELRHNSKNYKTFIGGIFRGMLSLMSSLFGKFYTNFYKINNTWLTFEIFILHLSNFIKFSAKRAVGIAQFFLKNKANFSLFFNVDSIFYKKIFFNLFLPWNLIKLSQKVNLYFWFDRIFIELNTFNFVFFWYSSIYVEYKILYSYCIFFKQFIQYNNYKYNYEWLQRYKNRNPLKKRIEKKNDNLISGFLGFKLQFKGRFSRKQRAANLWFQEGRVPLSTLSSKIEFAFYTVPLVNSAMTVRVWLNKLSKDADWYLKLN